MADGENTVVAPWLVERGDSRHIVARINGLERPGGTLFNQIADQLGKCGPWVFSRDTIQTVSHGRTEQVDHSCLNEYDAGVSNMRPNTMQTLLVKEAQLTLYFLLLSVCSALDKPASCWHKSGHCKDCGRRLNAFTQQT